MKKYLLGVAAIVLALGFSAFSGKSEKQEVTPKKVFATYYGFTGSDNADLNQTGSWVSLGTQAPAQCGGTNIVCIVSASQATLADFQSAIAKANPRSEAELDAMSGVDVYSHKN